MNPTRFINPAQVGGIQQYTLDNGEARGVRVCEVNTGSGLRYRVLVDRGLDIDHAFFDRHSLTFLTHRGPTAPTRALDRGLDWLRGFPGGLLTSCGPFNTGGPADDDGEEVGLHGPHSNTAATIESVIPPDPHAGRLEMSVTGRIHYGAFYGPNVTLRRTIRSTLGQAYVEVEDEFYNAGNAPVVHAWLLHINFGYPLLDEGTVFCINSTKNTPRPDPMSLAYFKDPSAGRTMPAPSPVQAKDGHVFRYTVPQPDAAGRVRAGLVNEKLGRGVAVDYSAEDFPRLGQWMHWGEREYVCALEPMTGGVEGRDVDRKKGWLRTLEAGERRTYRYRITAFDDPAELRELMDIGA